MDLWVRSQDRECLIKIKNISIDNENWVLGNLVSDDNKAICDYWKLGTYKTKERALEVLDEINEHIEKQGQTIAMTNEKGIVDGLKYYGKTYVMPKD